MKNPRRARARAETRTYGTDSPSRSKSRALSITPLHHPHKRRLNDGLLAHAIRSTRESSEDVTRTLDAPPSKVRSDIFPRFRRASSQTLENTSFQGAHRTNIYIHICIYIYVYIYILAGPALFRGRLRAFEMCTNGVASSKGRQILDSVRLTV